MEIAVSDLSKDEAYKLMNCMIVPRPIAWVTTVSTGGVVNLAPYSTFNIVCYDPPLLGMNMGHTVVGGLKDSSRNVQENGEIVVHIADESFVDAVHDSGFAHPADVSEAEILKLRLAPSVDVKVPRLLDAPLALECQLFQVVRFGASSDFIVARILRVHAREGLVNKNKIDSMQLQPLSRLAGPVYGGIGTTYDKSPVTVRGAT